MFKQTALQLAALSTEPQSAVCAFCTWGNDAGHSPAAGGTKPNRQTRRFIQASGIDISGDGYLRLKEVLSVYPVSRAGWYQGMAEGIYPKSVPLGKRAVGWTRESIRNLIANPPKF